MSTAKHVWAIAAAAAALLTVAGCTSPAAPAPSNAGSGSPSSPPTGSELAQLAQGDCAQLLRTDDLAASLGGSLKVHVTPTQWPLGIVGGIGCYYTFGEQGSDDSAQVYVAIAPQVIAVANELEGSIMAETCAPDGTDLQIGNPGCSATVAVSGWWYTLQVFTSVSPQDQKKSFETITQTLEKTLSATDATQIAVTVEPFDCDAADTGGLPVSSSRRTPDTQEGAMVVAAFRVAGPTTCQFTLPSGEQWSVDVYPGSASVYDSCISPGPILDGPAGSTVSVPGVATAFARLADPGVATVCATDGISTIAVHRQIDVEVAWDEPSLATVSSLAVPVLAAAH